MRLILSPGFNMLRDPVVEEIQRIRCEIEAVCGQNDQKYYDHIIKFQTKYRDRLVQRKPKQLLKHSIRKK